MVPEGSAYYLKRITSSGISSVKKGCVNKLLQMRVQKGVLLNLNHVTAIFVTGCADVNFYEILLRM